MGQTGSLVLMLVVCGALAALAFSRGGAPLLREGTLLGARMLLDFGAVLVISFLAAGLATVLVPRAWIESALGRDSGLRGLLIATGAGMITPAGPFVAMPIGAAMLRAGADTGPVVAYLTAWSLIAVHRLVAWEIPIIGLGLSLLRFGVSLLMPIAAGLLARVLVR
jgi:uncharacterized membrane protein YraQ (UPF0718 family)